MLPQAYLLLHPPTPSFTPPASVQGPTPLPWILTIASCSSSVFHSCPLPVQPPNSVQGLHQVTVALEGIWHCVVSSEAVVLRTASPACLTHLDAALTLPSLPEKACPQLDLCKWNPTGLQHPTSLPEDKSCDLGLQHPSVSIIVQKRQKILNLYSFLECISYICRRHGISDTVLTHYYPLF